MDTTKVQHFISNPLLSLIKSIVQRFTVQIQLTHGGSGQHSQEDTVYGVVLLSEWACYHLAEIVCSGLITG